MYGMFCCKMATTTAINRDFKVYCIGFDHFYIFTQWKIEHVLITYWGLLKENVNKIDGPKVKFLRF